MSTQPQSETEDQSESIDWNELWDEFGFPSSELVSTTQLKLMFDVSEQDAVGGAAKETALEAVNAGDLIVDKATGHTINGQKVLPIRGFRPTGEQ